MKHTPELIDKLSLYGGAIVSSNDCSELEIADARQHDRFAVDEAMFGYVLRTPEWLALQKSRETSPDAVVLRGSEVLRRDLERRLEAACAENAALKAQRQTQAEVAKSVWAQHEQQFAAMKQELDTRTREAIGEEFIAKEWETQKRLALAETVVAAARESCTATLIFLGGQPTEDDHWRASQSADALRKSLQAFDSERAAGVALKPLDEEPRKSLNVPVSDGFGGRA